jgi:Putative beta-barrel porin-2, OmpL-like. bbp2
MKKILLLLSLFVVAIMSAKAQDTVKTTADAPLVIYGSVDTYYKDDFSGHPNIGTSFGNENNSVSIGMFDLGLKKSVGNASFVGEVSFGPRGQAQSLPDATFGTLTGSSYHIQNLYVAYNLTPKLTATLGYMSTFVGYEVISPTGNFNYSTSYLFTAGPFQNAGFKLAYTFSDKVSLMAGIFNNYWNTYSSGTYINGTFSPVGGDVSTFGAQLTVTPVKNWTAYLNVLTGSYSGTVLDLTTAYQITSAFKLGLNAATKSGMGSANYDGVALYPQLAVSKAVTIGLRGEYFEVKSIPATATAPAIASSNVTALTASLNIKSGPFTFIPEIRFDNGSLPIFSDSSGSSTKSATQVLFAAVFAF